MQEVSGRSTRQGVDIPWSPPWLSTRLARTKKTRSSSASTAPCRQRTLFKNPWALTKANKVRTSRRADTSHALTLPTRSVPHHPRCLRICAGNTTGTPGQRAGLHLQCEEHATAVMAHVHDTPMATAGRHQRGGVTAAEARTCAPPLFAWSPVMRLHPSPCAGGRLCRRAAVSTRNCMLACSAPC